MEIYTSEDSKFKAPLKAADGEIKNYELENKMFFPCLIYYLGDNAVEYVARTMSGCVEKMPVIKTEVPEGSYYVYVCLNSDVNNPEKLTLQDGKKILIGYVLSNHLRVLMQGDLFHNIYKRLYLNKDEFEDGPLMLSYCTYSVL